MRYVILTIALFIIGGFMHQRLEAYVDSETTARIKELKLKGKPAYCDFYK